MCYYLNVHFQCQRVNAGRRLLGYDVGLIGKPTLRTVVLPSSPEQS